MMNKDNLGDFLIEMLPELQEEYRKIIEWYGTDYPGNHNIFCDVFNPYIINLLEKNNNKVLLRKSMNFLNLMAESEDLEVINVLKVTVLERIGDSMEWLEAAKEYMSPKLIKLSNEIEKELGRYRGD